MLEKDIEDVVVKYAESLGGEGYKLRKDGTNGYPDRTFRMPGNIEFLIEFKRPGEKLRDAQIKQIKRLRDLGARVYVVDNIEDGKRIIDLEMKNEN